MFRFWLNRGFILIIIGMFALYCSGGSKKKKSRKKASSSDYLTLLEVVPLDNTHIRLTFDEPVNKTSAETLSNYNITYTGGGLNIVSVSRDLNDSAILFITTAGQTSKTFYTLNISGLRAVDGSVLNGGSASGDFTGSAAPDLTAPYITSISPSVVKTAGAADKIRIQVDYSEAIQDSGVSIIVCDIKANPCPAMNQVAVTPAFTFSGGSPNRVQTDFAAGDLNSNTTYYVKLAGISDVSGNVATSSYFPFTTGTVDTLAPVITGITVVSSTALTLTLSEEIDSGGFGATDVTINGGIGNPNSAVVAGNIVYLGLASPLASPSTYVLTLANTVTDLAGNAVVSGSGDTIQFTYDSGIADTSSPYVTSITPLNNVSVRVYFNEPVQSASGTKASNYVFGSGVGVSGTITCVSAGSYYCDIPTSAQPVGTVTLDVASVKDIAGNSLTAYSGSFAGDSLPLVSSVVASYDPVLGDVITVYFNEPLATASTNVADYFLNSGALGVQSVSFTPNTNSIVLETNAQTAGASYALTFNGTASITDTTGNGLDASASIPAVYGADGPPAVSSVTQMSGSTFLVVYSEAVTSATAANTANYAINAPACTGCSVTGITQVSVSEYLVSVNKGDLTGGENLQLDISGIIDLNGNTMVGTVTAPAAPIVYAPGDTVSPSVSSIVSLDNTTIRVSFNEPMLADGSAYAANNAANYDLGGLSISSIDCSAGSYCNITTSAQDTVLYTFRIPASGKTMEDLASNSLDVSGGSSFTIVGTAPADTTAPTLFFATGINENTVDVTFSEAVDAASALQAGNYAISPGISVFSVQLTSDPTVVRLTTSGMGNSTTYTLVTANIKDISGNLIDPAADTVTYKGVSNSPPYILSVSALDDFTVAVLFSENIDPTSVDTVNRSNMSITGATSVDMVNDVNSVTVNNNVVTIYLKNPAAALNAGTHVFAANSIKDLAGNLIGSPASASFTSGTPPDFTISDASVSEGSGAAVLVYTVSLSAPYGNAITIDYASSDNGATAGDDYDAVSGTLTFNPNETSKTIAVPVNGDVLYEDDEGVTMTLSNASTGTISDTIGAGTIANDDAIPQITVSDVTVDEANGIATVSITMTNASADTVTVDYAASDATASVADFDYSLTGNTFTWNPGETGAKTVDITINDDTTLEANETFTVDVSNETPAGRVNLLDPSGTVTITNDDSVNIVINDLTVAENQTATVTASISGTADKDITVGFSTSNGSAGASDYTSTSGTLTWTPGTTADQSFTIVLNNDTLFELSETVQVALSNLLYGFFSVAGAVLRDAAGLVTITNDDTQPTVSLSQDVVTIAEAGGVAVITATLSTANGAGTVVNLNLSGSATSGSDYSVTTASLTIPAGSLSASTTLSAIDDNPLTDANETVIFDLGTVTNATAGGVTQVTVTITEDPVPTITTAALDNTNTFIDVTFSEALWTDAGNTAPVSAADLSLSFSANGGSASGVAINPPLTNTSGGALSGGETVIRVPLTVSGTPSGTETISITPAGSTAVYNASGVPAGGATSTGAVTLNEKILPTINAGSTLSSDNTTVTVNFSEGVYTNIAAGALTSGDFNVTFSANGGTATGAVITGVTHTAGATSATITISISGTPNGVETITITPLDSASIYDANGNAMDVAQTTGALTLNDKYGATITGGTVLAGNAGITVYFNEAVYTNTGASGALSASDFTIVFTQGSGTATGASITSVTHSAGGSSAVINLSVSGTPNGLETVEIKPANGSSIYDSSGNATLVTQTTNALFLKDQMPPAITNASLAAGNTSVTLTFDEGVYTNTGASGALSASDFTISFTQGSGTATNATISGVTHTAGSATVIVNLSVSGTPNGIETIEIKAASAAIYDANSNAALVTETSGVLTLNDKLGPSITSAMTLDTDGNGQIDYYKITFSENVTDLTFPGYTGANSLGTVTTAWLVAGYSNVQFAPGTSAPEADTANDNIIYIKFAESGAADTGSKPDVTTTASPGLNDANGNTISQLTTPDVVEVDGAKPVVISANGVNNNAASVVFSETVTATSTEVNGNYTITGSGGLTVSNAVMSGGATVDGNTVVLTTSNQTVGTNNYTVTVTAATITDLAGLQIASGFNSAVFSGQPAALTLVSATGVNNTGVNITFSADVKASSAECNSAATCSSIYSIPGLTVSNAVMSGGAGVDGPTVVLTTSSQTSSTTNGYTVTVTTATVQDSLTGTVTCDSPDNSASFTGDTLPRVVSASSTDATHVTVTFSEPVTWDTTSGGALLSTNYAFDNGLSVSSVASQTPNTVVKLTTSSQTASLLYTLTVANVTDITGNTLDAANDTASFLGLENIKIASMAEVTPNTATTFRILQVTFSKQFITDGGANAVNNLNNWKAPAGTQIVGICTSTDDTACPATGYANGDTLVYFKIDDGAGAQPAAGAYTFVGAGWDGAALTVTGASGCILPFGGTANGDCMQSNPNDRASVDFGALPTNPGDGPVYSDPFNDGVTLSGLVFTYNGKLMIGPNDTDSGIFQVDINMTNSTTITLDADSVTAGNQPFASPTLEDPSGNVLGGIDYFYSGCYNAAANVDSTLSGADCTAAGGTEYLFTLGYNTANAGTPGYNSNWYTTGTISPLVFTHFTSLSSNNTRTFRAMSIVVFKGWIYQASQHQAGSYAVRWNRFIPGASACPAEGGGGGAVNADNTCYTMAGRFLNRIGEAGTIPNGQGPATIGLISIDSMYEYDNDGTGTNESQLYIANGGSCSGTCLTAQFRDATTGSDGGILRSKPAYSTLASQPGLCTNATTCNAFWEDVTPTSANWLKFMSIPLPDDARAGGDWDALLPANTITPAIKAIPYMVNFNGDLYIIRNACSVTTVQTVAAGTFVTGGRQVCPSGSEVSQLWKLPKGTTATPSGPADWVFIGNVTSGKTTMAGATWSDTTNLATYAANNTHITLLAVVGNRLYVGFDNASNGANIWRTKSGVTSVTGESDFEAICDTGFVCADPAKQFGYGTVGDGITTNDIYRLFDKTVVNDAGTDYLVFTAGDGVNPVKVYRANNY